MSSFLPWDNLVGLLALLFEDGVDETVVLARLEACVKIGVSSRSELSLLLLAALGVFPATKRTK